MAGPCAGSRFALYSTTRGDYFFAEIRQLLACGLRSLGHAVVEADERQGFIPGTDWHVVIGPQEFFYLGSGNRLRTGPWPPGVVLYNAEQPGSDWFSLVRRLLPRAHAVWDMDRCAAGVWAKEGRPSSWLPLGWVEKCRLFEPVRRLPDLALTRTLSPAERRFPASFAQRPLDLLFAGSRVPRREAFFAAAGLARWRSVIHLVDDSRFLRHGRQAPLHTRALLGLAQRAKIVLNIHRQEDRYFEWHRVALHGVGQGALVVSEPTAAAPSFRAGRDFISVELDDMPAAIEHFLASAAGRREAARIAAQGLETYRRSCRLADFLPSAVARLGPAGQAEVRRRHNRVEAAMGLLLSRLR